MVWILCQPVWADDSITSQHPTSASQKIAAIAISDARQPLLPPTITTSAGYFTLKNTSGHELQIVGFSSPDFNSIEMHRSLIDNGIASMEMVKSLKVAPAATAFFEPGGLHLMLHKPKRVLIAGESFTIRVELADGKTIAFQMAVIPIGCDDCTYKSENLHAHHHE